MNFSKIPIHPPFPPMQAQIVGEIPRGPDWQYEPKWDGFRCIAFREGSSVELKSKSAQSLTRYFPELAAAAIKAESFVLDGEIILLSGGQAILRRSVAADPSGGEPGCEIIEGTAGAIGCFRSIGGHSRRILD